MCKYCDPYRNNEIFLSDDGERRIVAFVDEVGILQIMCIFKKNGRLVIWEDIKPILFCPMCGKKFHENE